METDIFSQETKVLADFKRIKADGTSSQSDFDTLVDQYGKLLRTTKKIIKLSDKNEQRLNQLNRSAGDQRTTGGHVRSIIQVSKSAVVQLDFLWLETRY